MKHIPLRASCLFALLMETITMTMTAHAQDKPARPSVLRDRITAKANTGISALLKPIQNVQITPLASGAIFSFDTRDATNPTVRIGTSAPTQEPRGRAGLLSWGFALGDEVPTFSAQRPQNLGGATTHTLRLQPVLSPNTTYYFLIEVRVAGAPPAVETGSFSTISRRVKVAVGQIHVLSGGDGASTGDLMFQFFLNYDKTTNRNFVWLGGRETTLQIPNGGSINAGKEFTLDNVDELRLVVNGYDEDFLRIGAPPSSGADNSVQVPFPLNGAGHNSAGAWNVAQGNFDLSASPPGARAITVPFTLSSLPIPNTGGGRDVAFEISGTYTILPTISRVGGSIGAAIRDHGAIFGKPKIGPPLPGPTETTAVVRHPPIRISPNR